MAKATRGPWLIVTPDVHGSLYLVGLEPQAPDAEVAMTQWTARNAHKKWKEGTHAVLSTKQRKIRGHDDGDDEEGT